MGDHKYKYTAFIERDFIIKSQNFISEVIGNTTNCVTKCKKNAQIK